MSIGDPFPPIAARDTLPDGRAALLPPLAEGRAPLLPCEEGLAVEREQVRGRHCVEREGAGGTPRQRLAEILEIDDVSGSEPAVVLLRPVDERAALETPLCIPLTVTLLMGALFVDGLGAERGQRELPREEQQQPALGLNEVVAPHLERGEAARARCLFGLTRQVSEELAAEGPVRDDVQDLVDAGAPRARGIGRAPPEEAVDGPWARAHLARAPGLSDVGRLGSVPRQPPEEVKHRGA